MQLRAEAFEPRATTEKKVAHGGGNGIDAGLDFAAARGEASAKVMVADGGSCLIESAMIAAKQTALGFSQPEDEFVNALLAALDKLVHAREGRVLRELGEVLAC